MKELYEMLDKLRPWNPLKIEINDILANDGSFEQIVGILFKYLNKIT